MPAFFITLRHLTVLRIRRVSGGILRITLGGPELGAFVRDGVECPPFATAAFDDHVKLFPPREPLVLPTQAQGHLVWPDDPAALTRDYTVRRYDEQLGEVDIEVATGHDGPGAAWAAQVAAGDTVHVAGPRGSSPPPGDAPAYLLVGDDASLPPIARFLDERPPGRPVRVVVAVDPANADYPLPLDATVLVRTADADPPELLDAVREALAEHPDAFVWAGLELTTARRLRGVLNEAGVARDRRFVTHYWQRGDVGSDDERHAAHHHLAPMIDLLTPMVLRVAVTIRLLDALAAGHGTPTAAAAATGCDPSAISMLLAYLANKELVTRGADGTYAVTPIGEHLLDEDGNYLATFLHLDSPSGHMASALPGLLHATRTGTSGYEQVHGRTFWAALSADDTLGRAFDEQLAGWADQWIPSVVAHEAARSATRIVDIGGGSGALAGALAQARDDVHVTLLEMPGPADRARAHVTTLGVADRVAVVDGDFFETLPAGADLYLLAQVLHDWTDRDAVAILRRCAEAMPANGRLLLIERLVDPDAPSTDDHAAMGVLMLALFGSQERTLEQYRALLHAAGLGISSVVQLPGRPGLVVAVPLSRLTP